MLRFPRWPAPVLLVGYVAVTLALAMAVPFAILSATGADLVQAGGMVLAMMATPYAAVAAILLAGVGLLGVHLARRLDATGALYWTFGAAWLACILGMILPEPHRLLHAGSWTGLAFLTLWFGWPALAWAAWAPLRYWEQRATWG